MHRRLSGGKSVRVVEYSAAVWSDDAQPVLSGKRFQLPLHLLAVAAVIFRKAAGVDDEVVHAALCRVADESVYRRCRSRDQHKLRNLRQFRQQRISPDTEYFTFALVDEIKPQLLLTFYKAFRRVAAERAGAVARADERDALWFEQLVQHILAVVFPLSAHPGSDHFSIFIIPVNIEILPVLLQLIKVFAVQPLVRFAERSVFQAAHRHPFYGQFSEILIFQALLPLRGVLGCNSLTLGFLGGVFLRLVALDAGLQCVNILLPARVILQRDV